jgi:hypothetical protein
MEVTHMAEYIYFELNGIQYRTDGVAVEGKDGSTWNRTHSLPVVLAAKRHTKYFAFGAFCT